MDRLVTIHMDHYDRETEVAITAAKSDISVEDAEWIVDIVRNFRRRRIGGHRPSIRAAITIARVMAYRHAACNPDDLLFQCICCDVLGLNRQGLRKRRESAFTRRRAGGNSGSLRIGRCCSRQFQLINTSNFPDFGRSSI